MERLIREFTLLAFARGFLHPTDRCSLRRLTSGCQDMDMAVAAIYSLAGRGV